MLYQEVRDKILRGQEEVRKNEYPEKVATLCTVGKFSKTSVKEHSKFGSPSGQFFLVFGRI